MTSDQQETTTNMKQPGGNAECPPQKVPLVKRRSFLVVFIMVLAHVLGFVTSINALMSTRTAPGTVAWIVSLNTFPYIALPAYWVFGRSKFQGYIVARREKVSELGMALSAKPAKVRPYVATPTNQWEGVEALEKLAKMSFLSGNRVELLIDGDETFKSIFEGIEAAEHYLLVQFYIVRDDALGRELKERLERKARQGVQVYFLYDAIGSYRLPESYANELTAAGVHVIDPNSNEVYKIRAL